MKALRAAIALGVLLGMSAVTPMVAATESRRTNQCINPAGVDLNELYDTDDAFATPFCSDGSVGSWVRPLVRWVVATTFEVVPDGYEPVGDTPTLDFVAKLTRTRYVVDAGTRQERSFTFDADDLLIATGSLPDDTMFIRFTPRLRPLSPGEHTIDIYVEMSADSWDGFGLEPGNLMPAGEQHLGSASIVVRSAHDPS